MTPALGSTLCCQPIDTDHPIPFFNTLGRYGNRFRKSSADGYRVENQLIVPRGCGSWHTSRGTE
jgi:hypothetical protein